MRARLVSAYARLPSISRTAVLLGLLVALVAFAVSLEDCRHYPGVDLRAKVVGGRALAARLNPYDYEWREGMSKRLLDPNRVHPGFTRVTYTPPLLLGYALFGRIHYKVLRAIEFAAEWAAMGALILLWTRSYARPSARVLFFTIAALGFAGAWDFRLHVERGQYYVFLTLLLSVVCLSFLRSRRGVGAGIALGLAIAFRPTLAVLAVVLFAYGERRLVLIGGAVAAALCALTLPFIGAAGWETYFELVQAFGSADHAALAARARYGAPYAVPRVAEGVEFDKMLFHYSTSVTLRDLLSTPGWAWARAAREHYAPISRALAAFTVSAAALLAFVARRRGRSRRFVAGLAITAMLFVDYFVAPERHRYVDVMLLLPIAALIPVLVRSRALSGFLAVALLGVVFGQDLSRSLEPYFSAAPQLRFFLVAGGLGSACAVSILGRARRPGGVQLALSASAQVTNSSK